MKLPLCDSRLTKEARNPVNCCFRRSRRPAGCWMRSELESESVTVSAMEMGKAGADPEEFLPAPAEAEAVEAAMASDSAKAPARGSRR